MILGKLKVDSLQSLWFQFHILWSSYRSELGLQYHYSLRWFINVKNKNHWIFLCSHSLSRVSLQAVRVYVSLWLLEKVIMVVQWREKQVRHRSSLRYGHFYFLLEQRRCETRITRTGAMDGVSTFFSLYLSLEADIWFNYAYKIYTIFGAIKLG